MDLFNTLIVAGVTPTMPPGMDKLTTLTAWAAGLMSFGLFLAFIISIGMTGLKALARGQFEGGQASVIILVCAVVLGAASAIFGTFGTVM